MYLVEGNIGAGKSTLLSLISKNMPSIEVVFESVNTWNKQDHGSSLLSHFYEDAHRWSYTMETFTMFTRIEEHLREQKKENPFKIIERSLYSGYYCFALNGYQQGYMTPIEWSLYTQWFTFLVENGCKRPHGFIYLKSSPETCYQRTLKRSRSGEESISLTYLKEIHEQHEDFLIKKKNINNSLKEVPVLVLDRSYEFENDQDALDEYLEKIQDFMLATHKAPCAANSTLL